MTYLNSVCRVSVIAPGEPNLLTDATNDAADEIIHPVHIGRYGCQYRAIKNPKIIDRNAGIVELGRKRGDDVGTIADTDQIDQHAGIALHTGA